MRGWLSAFYQFYFDYKCVVGYETAYFDHDVGFDYATYRSLDLFDKLYNIEDSERYITKYLWKDVMNKLNNLLLKGEAPRQTFYDIENNCFAFLKNQFEIAYHPDGVDNDSVAKLTLLEEIQLRRNHFVECINNYFDYDESKIVDFLTGYR